MCSISMVMDHKYSEWMRRYVETGGVDAGPAPQPVLRPAMPTQEELDEFRRLLDRAREYDRQHNQPDCELDEKRDRLKKLASELGVAIEFL